jgi:predicted GH43/DUF377 family glycosyl hydrolase
MPTRSPANPVIRPSDVPPSRPDFEVIGALNAAAVRLGEETLLLLRVVERPRNPDPSVYLAPVYDPAEGKLTLLSFPKGAPGFDFSDPRGIGTPQGAYLTGISHLRLARSRDGVHFTVEKEPALFPANESETFGIEDPRVTPVGADFYVTYVAVSRLGIVTCLARTRDFRTFERLGIIFPPDNKDGMLFPESIAGKYYALHRPSTSGFGRPEIWLAESPNLLDWGHHRRLIGLRPNGWEDARIGGGAPPFRSPPGWLAIYHGAGVDNRYCLAALLLDLAQPWKVLARSERPILEPEADYERQGFFGNVVFTCGATVENDRVRVYYGAADTCMALAEFSLEEILGSLIQSR